jgi:hypothetical protein
LAANWSGRFGSQSPPEYSAFLDAGIKPVVAAAAVPRRFATCACHSHAPDLAAVVAAIEQWRWTAAPRLRAHRGESDITVEFRPAVNVCNTLRSVQVRRHMNKHLHILMVAAAGCRARLGRRVSPQAAGRAPPGLSPEPSGFATFTPGCSATAIRTSIARRRRLRCARCRRKIYEALTTGVMQTQASALTDDQKKRVAEFMAGRPLGSAKQGDAANMGFQCRTNPPLTDPAKGPAWNGWSPDLANTRFQPAQVAGLTAAQVPRLKLKWAFGYPSGVSANAQPTIASGRVFVGSDNGYVYSIDAKTGCVYWSFENGSIIRNALIVGPVTGHGDAKYAVFFGDGHANVFALNAQDAKLLWKTKADPHFIARITAGVRYYDGKLIVPVVI